MLVLRGLRVAFDGADGAQMAFWTVERDAETAEHEHAFDEWFIVLEGSYALTLGGRAIEVRAGEECFIPKGTKIAGRVTAGTRTIHAFGGRRADRVRSGERGPSTDAFWFGQAYPPPDASGDRDATEG
jgi:uncharacterized cupin superfamily protein